MNKGIQKIIRLNSLLMLILVLTGGLSGCENNDSKSGKSYTNSMSSSSSSSMAMEKNIVEKAVDAGSFTTLVSALQAAGLDDDLAASGANLTVFAPTDAAFAALQASMSAEEYTALTSGDGFANILLYHVLPAEVDAAAAIAADGALVETLNGAKVAVSVMDGSVYINDAKVVNADIAASNGIIHVIDKVILPPQQTITDIVVEGDDFSTLEAAVTTAGLASTLAGEGPFTVFAPTNAAFAKLGQATIEAVLADNTLLTNILTYHVISGEVAAADAAAAVGNEVDMLNGEKAKITAVDNSLYIDGAKISVTNVLASNGVIHVIDSVMKPMDVAATDGNIVDILAADDHFSTLVTAVGAANLAATLSGAGPFTVFAPSNSAFAKLPEGTLESLLADIPALTNILTYHVLSGEVDSTAAVSAAGSSVTMVNGSDAAVTMDGTGLFIAGAKIVMTDIVASNGIIHVIDTVMLPSE